METNRSSLNSKEIKYYAKVGLIDPVTAPNGVRYYFDIKERKYYDPKTDIFLSNEELVEMIR